MSRKQDPSTIALFASARRNGNTGQLIDRIAQDLGIDVIDLSTRAIAPYDYEHKNRHDDFEPLMKQVLGFDQIIFASPIYWYGVSTPMKIFLDRLCDFLDLPELREQGRQLRGKRGFIACTSFQNEAATAFISSLQQTLEYLGMEYGGSVHANCREGYLEALYKNDIAAFIAGVRKGNVSPPFT